MTTSIAERPALDASVVEQVLLGGDLSRLQPNQRVSYYNRVCESLGLNPLTKPFAYITLNGKLQLYALKDATEQLRKLHGVSITEVTSSQVGDVFVVTAKAQDKSGRTDAATGAVATGNLKGEALANALMKAETKAKRRATLSICGLGMLDETEADSIPTTEPPPLVVDGAKVEDGAVVDAETSAPLPKLEEGCVYLLNVRSEPTSSGKARWRMDVLDHLGETKTVTMWEQQQAALAEQIAQEKAPALIALKKATQWGQDVKNLARFTPSEPEIQLRPDEPPPLTDADLAF